MSQEAKAPTFIIEGMIIPHTLVIEATYYVKFNFLADITLDH